MTPADIFIRVDDALQDAGGVRWSQAERLRYLNDGRREMAILRPDIYAQTVALSLVAGSRQAVPPGCIKLFDVQRNLLADGSPGRAIAVAEREVMDAFIPGWHSAPPAPSIRNFMFDERMPKVFWVFPPAAAGQKVELSMSAEPLDVGLNDDLTQEGAHAVLLVYYVIYRALIKDAEYAGNAALATQSYQSFMSGLGVSAKRAFSTSPNTANQGGVPSRVAAAEGG